MINNLYIKIDYHNNIYIYISKYNIIFYISTNKLQYKNIDCSISYIQYIIDSNNKEASLICLKTKTLFLNKGYATKLLTYSLKYFKKINIKKIELDDMSDRSWKDNNIYIYFGFKYINQFPEPEMVLLIK
jgi:hypothetical protein